MSDEEHPIKVNMDEFRTLVVRMMSAGETPRRMVRAIDELARDHCLLMNEQFCRNSWDVEDVQTVFDLNDADAATFLQSIESRLNERMTERGWEVIEQLGDEQNLPRYEPDEENDKQSC